jgi:uncharacterized coiled-coil DUF342 family protein
MKKYFLLLCLLIAQFGCNSDNENDPQNQVNGLNDSAIASINQQIEAINRTLPTLVATSNELKGYITSLQANAANMQEAIDGIDDKIAQTKQDVGDDLSVEKANIIAQLDALKKTMDGELQTIKNTISSLQPKKAGLDQDISGLKEYVDKELASTKEWTTATFATLAQYETIASDIATMQTNIENLNSYITDIETQVKEVVSKELDNAAEGLLSEFQEEIQEIVNSCTQAVTTAKEEITASYTLAIQTAINNSTTAMKSWVNSQLAGYYTIAQADAMLTSLKESLESQLTAQKTYLEGVIGTLDDKLRADIADNSALIANLKAELTSLDGDVADNAAAIIANSDKISKNAKDITNNTTAIGKNTNDIAANNRLIAANTVLINDNADLIKANKDAIALLQSGVATNAGNIADNAADIAKNAKLISANTAAIANNTAAITTNSAEISQLKKDLQTTKTEITAAYQEAIATAIETLNGTLPGKIATEVATRVDDEVEAINSKITALTTRVATLETDVKNIKNVIAGIQDDISDIQDELAALLARIQSVSYIPKYADGKATMTYSVKSSIITPGTAVLDYEVKPTTAAAAIVAVWDKVLKVKGISTLVSRTVVPYLNMPIIDVTEETTGVLSVQVSGENLSNSFFLNTTSASAALELSDGNNNIITEYVVLSPKEVTEIKLSDPSAIAFTDANLKAYLVANYDDDLNGEISNTEALTALSINAPGLGIKSLDGLEMFTNLTSINVSNNDLDKIDVSTLTKLQQLSCYGNHIVDLNVSNCTALQYLYLQNVSTNSIKGTSVTISNYDQTSLTCSMVATLFDALSIVDSPTLLSVNVENNDKVKTFNCYNNTALTDVELCDCLEEVNAYSNTALTSIDVFALSKLSKLDVHGCALTALNVTNNSDLAYLYCNNNVLPSLNVQSNASLLELECQGNNLPSLNVTANSLLQKLDCSDNSLAAINVRNNLGLKYLAVNNNSISMLNTTQNTVLEELYCQNLSIIELDVTKNTALKTLYCNYNSNLTALKVWFNITTDGSDVQNVCIVKGSNTFINNHKHAIDERINYSGGGVVYELSSTTERSGKVHSLDTASKQWSTETVVTGATDWGDGRVNMKIIQAIPDWKNKYPAFYWCYQHGSTWYLPAANESAVLGGFWTSTEIDSHWSHDSDRGLTFKTDDRTTIAISWF